MIFVEPDRKFDKLSFIVVGRLPHTPRSAPPFGRRGSGGCFALIRRCNPPPDTPRSPRLNDNLPPPQFYRYVAVFAYDKLHGADVFIVELLTFRFGHTHAGGLIDLVEHNINV